MRQFPGRYGLLGAAVEFDFENIAVLFHENPAQQSAQF